MSPVCSTPDPAPSVRPRPIGGLGLCLALTLALHLAAGWACWHRSAVPPAHDLAHRHALSVRLVATVSARPAPAKDSPSSAATPPPEPVPAVPQPAITAALEAPMAAQQATEPPYFTRGELDVGPAPQEAVVIPFPASTADVPHRSGVLTLFIDENGMVQRVVFDDTDQTLTPAMQQVARATLLGTRFNPGQKDGLAVRSRIDIEVSFDVSPAGNVEANAQRDAPTQLARSGA